MCSHATNRAFVDTPTRNTGLFISRTYYTAMQSPSPIICGKWDTNLNTTKTTSHISKNIELEKILKAIPLCSITPSA